MSLQEQLDAAKSKLQDVVENAASTVAGVTEEVNVVSGTIQEALSKVSSTLGYTGKKGDYKNIRCHSIIIGDGTKFTPNEFGFYEVATLPQEAKDMLKSFKEKGYVELVKG